MISATITGRLTSEPDLRYTKGGQAVAELRVASDNRDGTATFLDVTIWAKKGEAAAEHLVQGQHVTIAGTLESNEWTDNDGNTRTSWRLKEHSSEWHAKPQAAYANGS